MKNLTANLATSSHTIFWVAIFPFHQKWHHAYLEGLLRGRGFPTYWVLPQVSTSPDTREDKSTFYSKYNDPFLTLFAPTNQKYLLWGLYTLKC